MALSEQMAKPVPGAISGKCWMGCCGYYEQVHPGKTCRQIIHPIRPVIAGFSSG